MHVYGVWSMYMHVLRTPSPYSYGRDQPIHAITVPSRSAANMLVRLPIRPRGILPWGHAPRVRSPTLIRRLATIADSPRSETVALAHSLECANVLVAQHTMSSSLVVVTQAPKPAPPQLAWAPELPSSRHPWII